MYPERRPVLRAHRRNHNLTLTYVGRIGMVPPPSAAPARPPCRAAGQAQSLQLTDQSAQDQIRRLTSEYTRFLTTVHIAVALIAYGL